MTNKLLTATLVLAITFTLGCGNHTWEDILFGSSSSEEEISSSSLSSSSSRASSSSSGPVEAWRKYLYTPQTRLENVSAYSVEVKEYNVTLTEVDWLGDKTSNKMSATVYYTLPKKITADTKILLAMHGSGMNDDFFAKQLRYISEKENIAIISALWQPKRPSLDELFEDFVNRFDLKAQKYILYGFSAGGSFANRLGQFSDSKYIDYVIVHSVGSPNCAYFDESLPCSADINDAYRNTHRNVLLQNLENRITYFIAGTSESAWEGSIELFENGKAYSERYNLMYPKKLFIMEGVWHNVDKALPWILDIIKGLTD